MTESEWLECDDPLRMLRFLRADARSRKPMLLTCACLRRIWEPLPEEGRAWVELAEQFVEVRSSLDLLDMAGEGCEYAIQRAGSESGWGEDGVIWAIQQVFHVYWELPEDEVEEDGNENWQAERREQALLVRDICGNPFRKVRVDAHWLTWSDGTVGKLAQAAYEERSLPQGKVDKNRLAVLADALEESGCSEQELLTHLRGPGPHVRGCWALDLLLGKE